MIAELVGWFSSRFIEQAKNQQNFVFFLFLFFIFDIFWHCSGTH